MRSICSSAALVMGLATAACNEHPGTAHTPQQWHDQVGREIEARKGALSMCTRVAEDPGAKAVVTIYFQGQPNKFAGYDGTLRFTTYENASDDDYALWDGPKLTPPGKDESTDKELIDCVKLVLQGIAMPADDSHIGAGQWRIVLDPKAPPGSG
jgi:hypothetical protein